MITQPHRPIIKTSCTKGLNLISHTYLLKVRQIADLGVNHLYLIMLFVLRKIPCSITQKRHSTGKLFVSDTTEYTFVASYLDLLSLEMRVATL